MPAGGDGGYVIPASFFEEFLFCFIGEGSLLTPCGCDEGREKADWVCSNQMPT